LTSTNTTATAALTAGFVNCISLNGKFPNLKANTITGTVIAHSGTPCSLLLTITGTATVTWNTGRRSGSTYDVNTNPTNGTISLSATITSGPTKGDTVNAVPVEVHFLRTRPRCHANNVAGVTSRPLSECGSILASAARTTRSGQVKRGLLTWRRGTAISWRSASTSVINAVLLPESNASRSSIRTVIWYRRRNHGRLSCTALAANGNSRSQHEC
jgi:hypothetical protein